MKVDMVGRAMTKSEIIDILENHDIELYTLEKQLSELKKDMDAELTKEMSIVLPGAISYDKEVVQATPKRQDEKLTTYITVADSIRGEYQLHFDRIFQRIRDIHNVYSSIHLLDSLGKSVILNLYYPRSTVLEVSQELNMDPKTITRKKHESIEILEKILKKRDTNPIESHRFP